MKYQLNKSDLPVKAKDRARALVEAIAMDIGKDTVAYIEVMYPDAIKATASTFKLSVRNHIFNEIISHVGLSDEQEIVDDLARRQSWREECLAIYRRIRRKRAYNQPGKEIKQIKFNPNEPPVT